MSLFQAGVFQLHSGQTSRFLIDCDALTEDDLFALAAVAERVLPAFGRVKSVPRGGDRFAEFMRRRVWASDTPTTLIVDDVWTTGASMKKARGDDLNVIGLVIFARSETPWWVTPLFQSRSLG